MWIKREKYESLVKFEGQLELRREQIARLEKEVDYWRERFEEAQRRTDRIHDKTLVTSGLGPVSDLGLKELTDQSGIYQKMVRDAEKHATEMFSEEVGEGGEGSFEFDPELLSSVVAGMRVE